MQNKLLLPNKFKIIGWCLLIPAAILGLVIGFLPLEAVIGKVLTSLNMGSDQSFGETEIKMIITVTGVLFIVGAMFVAFSKEKQEDEFIAKLRLSSLLWAVWVNYILLLLAILFIYGTAFRIVLVYNMFTVLIIFIARFNYILHKTSKVMSREK